MGLAPGLRGANRSGRPFTGDTAGELLYATLKRLSLATGSYEARADDGFELKGVRICNAVQCVPPQNKPTTTEIATCRRFLSATLDRFSSARVILALGGIAHQSVLAALGEARAPHPFAHGARYRLGGRRVLFDSYHCSRLNTNTGRLTEAMFEKVVAAAKAEARL